MVSRPLIVISAVLFAGLFGLLLFQLRTQQNAIDELQESRSLHESWDIRERCATQGQRLFAQLGYNGRDQSFINHYNAAMNKCFVLVEDIRIEQGIMATTFQMFDALEGKKYGNFTELTRNTALDGIVTCWVESTQCKSRGEFNKLIEAYVGYRH